jgi:curved DNA-binding protein CbpA
MPQENFEQFESKDPYKVLGVPHNTTFEEIQSKYGELARKYHPDQHIDDGADTLRIMQKISGAYAKLKKLEPDRKRAKPSASKETSSSRKPTDKSAKPSGFENKTDDDFFKQKAYEKELREKIKEQKEKEVREDFERILNNPKIPNNVKMKIRENLYYN